MRLIFGKLGPVKGPSLLPIRGYGFIFNRMSDLTTDGRTRSAFRIVEAHGGGEVLKPSWRPARDPLLTLERSVGRQDEREQELLTSHAVYHMPLTAESFFENERT